MALAAFSHPVPRGPGGRLPKISSGFHSTDRPQHSGSDIMYPRSPNDGGVPKQYSLPSLSPGHFMPLGTPILAIGDGVVAAVKAIEPWRVIIDHAGGLQSEYRHISGKPNPALRVAPLVREGQRVTRGQQIGFVGYNPDPGGFKLAHLHFQLRQNGALIDPAPLLAQLQVLTNPVPVRRLLVGVALAVGGFTAYQLWKSRRASHA